MSTRYAVGAIIVASASLLLFAACRQEEGARLPAGDPLTGGDPASLGDAPSGGDLDQGDPGPGDGPLVGPGAQLCLAPAGTVDFGPTVRGYSPTTSAFSFATAYVDNCSDADVTVADVQLVSGIDQGFSITFFPFVGASYVLVPGDRLPIEMDFHPVTEGSVTGTLRVSLAPNGAVDFPLAAEGIADPGGCVLQVGPTVATGATPAESVLDFGAVSVGETRGETFIIANVGILPCTITSISTPSQAEGFTLRYPTQIDVPKELFFRQLKLINLDYQPPTAGSHTSSVVVISNDVLHGTRTMTVEGTASN